MSVSFRSAGPADIPAVAALFARSRAAALPFLPVLHTAEQDLLFFGGYLSRGTITLAEEQGRLLGFVAETPGWIDHLYLEPDMRGRGIGTRLLDGVKSRQDRLELWCFEQNAPACGFYAAQGFMKVRRTPGDNEEGLPDILFRWCR